MGNIITKIISVINNTDFETSRDTYFYAVKQNMNIIIIVTIIFAFIILFRIFLNWFTKYFDEMIENINKLTEKDAVISMSNELSFMEEKLKQVKFYLEMANEKERELEQKKNDLIVYLAHDIKTPLTSVIGYLNLLKEIPYMPVEQRVKHVDITIEKAYRLEKLLDEFFEITRYNVNTVLLHKEEVDLQYMLLQIKDETYPLLEKSSREISINIGENLFINIDREKMARVFNNILKNAINYGENDGLIEILVKNKENTVEINFKNKGVIAKDKLEVIFDKFYRVDSARSTKTGGSGLGLAIAKDIVELHDGEIIAKSEDSYTIFTVILPK